ncbi:MAG: hypothetical protein KBG82_02835 [Spirochaetes bacterium]|nr:hypothetical protein [Spirochaetota bacterium]
MINIDIDPPKWHDVIDIIMENKEIMIIGECKSQLSKKGVEEFIRKKLDKLKKRKENNRPSFFKHIINIRC